MTEPSLPELDNPERQVYTAITGHEHSVIIGQLKQLDRWADFGCANCGWTDTVHRSKIATFVAPLSCTGGNEGATHE